MFRFAWLIASLYFLIATNSFAAEKFNVISWNVEVEGSDADIIAEQLVELPRSEIYLLQEVSSRSINRYAAKIRETLGNEYKFFVSSFGGPHKLGIIVNQARFKVRGFSELMSHGDYQLNNWRMRSPLAVELETKSGIRFKVLTVHLARGNAKFRQEQANGLREWVADQTEPVFLAGDCNFDFDIPTKRGNRAWENFFRDDVWQLAEPTEWIDTNWDDRDGDGKDNYPGSTLDFAAYRSASTPLSADCHIVVREGDFPDNQRTSDHRPLSIEVTLGE